MDWRFQVEAVVSLPNSFETPEGIRFTLNMPAGASPRGVVEGGVTFTCKTPPFLDGCFCLVDDLKHDPPSVEEPVNTDVYTGAQFVGGFLGQLAAALQGVPGVNIPVPEVTAPSARLVPRVSATTISGGRCLAITVEVELRYTAGKVKIPAFNIPVAAIQVPMGPYDFSFGESGESILTAQYKLCCCSWTEELDQLPVHDPTQEFQESEPTVLDGLNCGCGDYSSEFRASAVRGSGEFIAGGGAFVSWKITAAEGGCPWVIGVDIDPSGSGGGGGTATKKSNPPKAPVPRTPA